MKYLMILLILAALVVGGCAAPDLASAPEETATPVKTQRPTFTPMPASTDTPAPTNTLLPTDTPFPTETPVPPTDTPVPPTETPAPTDTPVPTAPPAPTRAPTRAPTQVPAPAPTKPPANQPKHVVGSRGVSGLVIARDKTTFVVGEKAFFIYEAINHTQDPVGFVKLGIKASNGAFNTSWINPDVVQPGVPFRHDDGLTFDAPGTYNVFLAICWEDPCSEPSGVWEEFRQGAATITVK